MSVYKLVKKYYPRLWSIERINALLEAGKITPEEYEDITREESVQSEQ